MCGEMNKHYDVVIVGAGMAGLTLARHLLLHTDKSILLLDKLPVPPGPSQKVGESLVQLSGYYLSKVLDLEEHLLVEHYLKYNLRFQWKTEGRKNCGLEDYSVSFIRLGSNIPTFQLDRNVLESHLLRLNRANPRLHFFGGVRDLNVELAEGGEHRISFARSQAACTWVVDASGRGSFLKRRLSLSQPNSIRHGATWCWVEGLVNIEKLTDRAPAAVRLDPLRRKTGHFPTFLATNHFCGEGQWFWVIPLHGKTSLGLVYDCTSVRHEEVSNARKMIQYVCREWPLFAYDLPQRKILDEGRYADFSYDARQTISSARWALTGEAGRFSDPLYSPGSDLISIHNTLIVDCIRTDDARVLEDKCRLYELIMRVMYESYVPSYAVTYNCLGDQEAFTLKYTWELAVYFGFFVVPFINDLFTDAEFMSFHMRKYALLGQINRNLQEFLSAFYRWKRANPRPSGEPNHIDFYELKSLRRSETLFYAVGLSPEEAKETMATHVAQLKEFARYILAHVHAVVLEDKKVLLNAPFVSSLKLRNTVFDPERMKAAYAPFAGAAEIYPWDLSPFALEKFFPAQQAHAEVSA